MLMVHKQQKYLDLNIILEEVRTLSHPRVRSHANIIQLKSWGYDYPDLDVDKAIPILLMEKASASVHDFLKQRPCSIDIKQQLCLGTAEGLACLHVCGIVHADLNPRNVLVIAQGNPEVPFIAKVSDFGSSIDVSDRTSYYRYSDYLGTPGWTPPEVDVVRDHGILDSGTELFKCDSWAFGLFLFSVFCVNGQKPVDPHCFSFSDGVCSLPSSLVKKLHGCCLLLLASNPNDRPQISSELLNDGSKAYKEWSRTRDIASKPVIRIERDYEYHFWTSIDTSLLSQLDSEYEALASSGIPFNIPQNVLLGMALGYFQNNFPSLGMKYIRMAAEAGSDAAKGIVGRLFRAIEPFNPLPPEDKTTLEINCSMWLYDAASSGSIIAAADLTSLSASMYTTARDHFRHRGGYHTILPYDNQYDTTNESGTVSTVRGDAKLYVYEAAAQGNHARVLELLSLSADVTVASQPFGVTPLHWLFMFETSHVEEIAIKLLSAGALLEARTTTLKEGIFRVHIPSLHFPFHWPIGTPFHWACFARCWAAMNVLLKLGTEVDGLDAEDDDQAQTPLAMAMYRGDSEVVAFLLNHGADPRRVDGKGRSPLHMLALDYGQNRLFRLKKTMWWRCFHGTEANHINEIRQCAVALVRAGGDLECRRRNNQTPLQDALETKDGAVVMALVELGADVGCRFKCLGRLPVLHWLGWVDARAMAYPSLFLPVLKILLTKSCFYDLKDSEERTIYHALVQNAPTPEEDHIYGDFQRLYSYTIAAAELLKVSAFKYTVNDRDVHGITPLLQALSSDTVFAKELAQLLCDHGASKGSDLFERQELIWKICNSQSLGDHACLELVKGYLIDLPLDRRGSILTMINHPPRDRRRNQSRSALMCAISNGYIETVQWMLDLPNLDINQLSENGHTALDKALNSAEASRISALQRWSTHASTVPKARQRSDYNKLFWRPRYSPSLASSKMSKISSPRNCACD